MTSEAVRVIVRCRPFNAREKQLKSKNIIEINTSTLQCTISSPQDANIPPKTFTFDGVYDQASTTEQIYTDFVYSLVEGVIEGYNATVFAYGQTGSGKSFTMQGVSSPSSQSGILPRTFEHLFESMAASQGVKYLVFASYLEIYNEEIRDLLSSDIKRKLELREDQSDRGVYVAQLSQHPVQSVQDCHRLMENGWKNRAVGATLMNADSSRSHSIFTISLERMEVLNGSAQAIRCGKLNLVDLAGSERQSKTGASGDRLKEATKINLSLSALGNVISALVDGKSKHIPYRDSKLTRLLQDSLGGNTKTLMISCISPADDNYDETLSTLRYANRAKNIQNRPRINQDPKEAMLKEYQMEIERLRQLLDNAALPPSEAETLRLERERQQVKAEYEEKIRSLQLEIEKEQQTNAKAAVELENLRRHYQDELHKINQNVPPTSASVVVDGKTEETLKKLKEIEDNLVGGERANDTEFQERRWKKKTLAERRMALLAQLLAKTRDEDGSLLRVYDDIQQEMRDKSEVIKKYKAKLRSLDRDIEDLQSEFQSERVDYLETIRRQDQQLRLVHQILGKVQLIIRKDCNYSDLESVMQNCIWSDEFQRWKLPEVNFFRTKLPPAGKNGMLQNNCETVAEYAEEPTGDRLLQKLERGEAEDLAGRYFLPSRAKQIINKSHHDVHRAIQLTKQVKIAPISQSHTSLNHFKGPVNGGESNSLHVSTSLPTSWSAPNSLNNNINGWTGGNGLTNGPGMARKPKRLESLAGAAGATTEGHKVSAFNDINVIDVT